MGMVAKKITLLWVLLALASPLYGHGATTFTMVNQCSFTIWPAFWTHQGGGGGTQLHPGQTWTLGTYPAWSGRIWARTGCHFGHLGKGSCSTGDCGSLSCARGGAAGSTLFEVTLDASSNRDFYDLSIIDGFNLGIKAVPSTSGCSPLNCLNSGYCPDAAHNHASANIKTCPYGGDYTIYFCAS